MATDSWDAKGPRVRDSPTCAIMSARVANLNIQLRSHAHHGAWGRRIVKRGTTAPLLGPQGRSEEEPDHAELLGLALHREGRQGDMG